MKSSMKNDAGFSLLELVVAVGVLLIASVTAGTLLNSSIQKANKQSVVEIAVNEGYTSAVKAVMDFDENTTVAGALVEIEARDFNNGQIILEQIGEANHQDELCIKGTWFDDPSITLTKGACDTYTPAPVESPVVNVPVVSTLRYVCDTDTTGDLPIVGASASTRVRLVELTNGNRATDATYNSSSSAYHATMKAGVEYEVRISGTFAKLDTIFGTAETRAAFNDCLIGVQKLDEKSGITGIGWIGGAKFVDVPNAIPSTVTSLKGVFQDAVNFNNPNVNKWDVSNVTDFSYMFANAESFAQDLDEWVFTEASTKTVNTRFMFSEADSFNGDITAWNTERFTTIQAMFARALQFNQDLSNWDTSNAVSMSQVFNGAESFNNGDVAGGSDVPFTWDTSKAKSMQSMFSGTAFNQEVSGFNTSNVTNMFLMFNSAEYFNQPVNTWTDSDGVKRWDVSNVTNFERMFGSALEFNQSLDNWNMSNAVTISRMFQNAANFNNGMNAGEGLSTASGMGKWNLSNVTDMSAVFYFASSFNQNLNGWSFSKVTSARAMFFYAESFNSGQQSGVYSNQLNWNQKLSTVQDFSYMFQNARSYNQAVVYWNTESATTMRNMFKSAETFNPLSLMANNSYGSAWDVSNVTDMSEMFYGATSFNKNLETLDVSNVKNMRMMFYGATSYNQRLAGWNNKLGNVENVAYMFYGAASFNQDLTGWQVPKVSVRAGFYYDTSKSPVWVLPEVPDVGLSIRNPDPKAE